MRSRVRRHSSLPRLSATDPSLSAAAIEAFLPPTESHNSLADPAPAVAEPSAASPEATLDGESIVEPPASAPLPDFAESQSEPIAPVEAGSASTETHRDLAESDAPAGAAVPIDEPNTADVADNAPQSEAPGENADPSGAQAPVAGTNTEGTTLLDFLDEKLFPPDSKAATESETNPPAPVIAPADLPPAAAAPDDFARADANATSPNAEPSTDPEELNEVDAAQVCVSTSEATPVEPPHAAIAPADVQHDVGEVESNPNFDKVVYQVTRMMYGEENVTKMNLRLVRLALEHYKVDELVIKP